MYPPPWLVGKGIVVMSWWGGMVCVSRREKGELDYLSCSIGVSWRMLSHMCSSWYFPRFLFKVGSFTLINMASLMYLKVP